MQQGYSENNFLINQEEEEYNFQDSVVLNPINLNPGLFNNDQPKTKNMISISKAALGSYEQFKLSKYLNKQLAQPTNKVNYLNINNQDNRGSSVIQVVNIDQVSNVLEIGPKFSQLMKKYTTSDVCFVTVIGGKGVGKSFFLDKILNLSDVKGNNFCQKQKPAIYAYPVPYMKDGLQIFLLQIGGCQLESEAFGLLNVISLTLSSAYLVLTNYQKSELQNDWELLQKALTNCISAFFSRESNYQKWVGLYVHNLYYLSRRKQSKKLTAGLVKDLYFFRDIQVLNLPNAMTSNYKGPKEDLTTYSFLVKQCINPQYIKSVSQIFKTIYSHIQQKKIGDLILNGKVVSKVLEYIVSSLNSQKNICLDHMCDQILKQLYISAYNYCVMLYHQELQAYFEDEKPKNLQQMYSVLERASNNALTKFKEFNLTAYLSQQYEFKLIKHIQNKEELICKINKQKTKQYLQEQFDIKQVKSVQDVLPFLKNLRQKKKQLNDGRLEALKKTFTQLYLMVGGGTNVNNSLQRQLEQRSNQLESQIKQAKAQLSKKENANRKRIEEERMIQEKLRKEEQQVQRQYSKVKAVSQSQIGEDEIQKITQEIKTLQNNLQQMGDGSNLPDINLEIAEACKGNEAKLKQLTERQKQLTKEIEDLKNAKTATGQSKQKGKGNENEVSKMKSSEQKPKPNKKEGKK